MKPHVLLRAASLLTLIHAVLHTFGGLLHAPSRGPKEAELLSAMKAFQFDAMGSLRTYWDFYLGFGLFVTVSLVLLAVLMWQLGSLVKVDPAKARPFIASLTVAFIAIAVLSWAFFFVAPLVTEVLIAVLLGVAYVLARPAA